MVDSHKNVLTHRTYVPSTNPLAYWGPRAKRAAFVFPLWKKKFNDGIVFNGVITVIRLIVPPGPFAALFMSSLWPYYRMPYWNWSVVWALLQKCLRCFEKFVPLYLPYILMFLYFYGILLFLNQFGALRNLVFYSRHGQGLITDFSIGTGMRAFNSSSKDIPPNDLALWKH